MRRIFFGVMGAPYESELSTTLFRMIDEALRQGHHVSVWTCGGATTLTQSSLGEEKPRNLMDLVTGRRDAIYPTTAALVRGFLTGAGGRLEWRVCRHCADERGAGPHVEGVSVASPFRFLSQMERADVALVLGVK